MKVREIDLDVIVFGSMATIGAIVIMLVLYATSIQPTEGYVIRKDYIAAHSETRYKYMHKGNEQIRVPQQEWVDAQYTITISGKNKNGKEARATYAVTAEEYSQIELGDYYIKEKKK